MIRPWLAVVAAVAGALGCRQVLGLEEKRLTVDAADAAVIDASSDAPVCPDGLTKCGEGCLDLTHDSANCGRCGRSCAPTTCERSLCIPRYVATTGGLTHGLTQRDAYVYWTTDTGGGRVARAAKSGSAAAEILASDAGSPVGIEVRDENVFWTTPSAGTISRTPLDGGLRETLVDDQANATTITMDESSIYFTRDTAAGDVRKIPLDGGAASVLVPSRVDPKAVVVDATRVYWTENGGVWRADKSGANPSPLSNAPAGASLVIDDASVYVAEPSERTIVRIDKATGSKTAIVSDVVAGDLTVDDTDVYWTNPAQGVVASAPKNGGAIRNLAVDQVAATFVMVDATTVYWIAGTDGILFAVPK